MADNVAITAGSGTSVAADEVVDGTLGTVKVQYVKLMDGTLDGTTKLTIGANGAKVDPTSAVAMNTGTRSATTQRVTVATDDLVPVTGTITAVTAISNALPAGTNLLGKVDVQFAGTVPDTGSGTGGSKTQRVIMDSSQLAALSTTSQAMSAGYQLVGLPTDLTWPKGLSNRVFVAAFSTLTRPANTTAYSAFDSISDNATAGSVTALSATVSDVNDDPIFINEIVINSTDTGLAGKRIRAYLYNSDPTASTGVGGGDNAAFANKKAGYIASFSGKLETGFSDGTVGRLVPTFNNTSDTTDYGGQPAGGFITVKPTSGAKTLFIQFQAIDGFTPSANSTTIIASARGWQGRAA